MADLGAIEADVPFDYGVADALISACNAAAAAVAGQAGPRASWTTTALTDFKGHFSSLFRTNASVAAGDATELASRLREVATAAGRLKEEARKEQQRRETARAWKKEHDERGALDKIGDFLSGGDDPPVGPPADEPTIAVSAPVNRTRETPGPGSGGGGGGGTSSARPSNLRTFATGSKGANDTLRSKPGALRAQYSSFQSSCRWGTLDASGVFTGFDRWLTANDEDVRWATTVADAFTAAGGEGAVSTVANSAVSAALHAAGVNQARVDLVIDPPQAYGNPPTTGYADDPVNTSTGNFVENEVDLGFPGAASSLTLARCYNSANRAGGAFGTGWSSLTEAGLAFDTAEGRASLTLPDGRRIVFQRLGAAWDRAVGENLWLTADPNGGLRVDGNNGAWWRLSSDGTLVAQGTGPEDEGNLVRLVRDGLARLVRLEHGRGRSVELTWGVVAGQDRVVAATSSDGRTVDYGYDEDGRLTAATGPLGTRSYRWDEQGLVTAVVDADGVVEVENSYDEQGRVVAQRSPFGRVTRFAYLPGRVTVASDTDGNRSNTWIADERGRLVGVVDAEEHRQSTSYDRWGNPVLFTERDGATTVHEYDARGRRVRTVTPSGADLTFGYDDADRVTTVVTEEGAVTGYTYDGEARNPSTITDPEGGVTELEWAAALLQQVTDPTGVVVRFGYDECGDLTAVTDADGGTARMERDDLGRVTAAVTPSGHRTTYAYHPVTGLLTSRTDPDGAVWRFEHTAAGRMLAAVDPLGARTSVEHGQHGEESRTIDPLGRAVTRQLDDLGNLAAVELPDGSSWRFVSDALSRLVATTDPTGSSWTREYDLSGRLVATVDPTGVRRGVDADQTTGRLTVDDGSDAATTAFDPLGRVISVGEVDGSAAVLTYDRCGRPVEALDVEGGLTSITRDAAGRVVELKSPAGAVTRYEYDRCGRLAAVLDPAGSRTAIEYDADGHPVRQTLPTGEVASTDYDRCGRVLSHRRPGVGTYTYTYDLAGRIVASRDPASSRRRFRYDAAGQLLEAVDANGGVTRYGYDDLGRAVEITNPVGGVTRRRFDAMNRCVAETDPLDRTTRAGYDDAGRLAWQTDPDGHTTTWTYDAAGRPKSMAVDGRTLTTLTRDLRAREVTVDDRTGDEPVTHVLEWNRRGQLVRRSRGGSEVSWSYDADGRRTAMTTPDGATTRYRWDGAGWLVEVDHTVLGRAAFDRDAAGRLVSATAGGLIQAWEYRDGWVVGHTLTDGHGAFRTELQRDDDGQITRIGRDGRDGEEVTSYLYDAAGQLVEASTRESVSRWRYDPAGRLVAESTGDLTTTHVYDLAGQLLTSRSAEGRRAAHRYDGSGRRTWSSVDGKAARELTWSATGHLAVVTDHQGDQVRHTRMHADALGELASVKGGGGPTTQFFWDTAAYAGSPVLVGETPVLTAGPVTGIGDQWTAPGWRTSRATGTDPWSAATAATADGTAIAAGPGGTTGLRIGAAGEVTIEGLEWLGARVYDPSSRGFLSTDPLDPVTGAGWAGNPYAYAGNDPLHALDPRGLRPVTDAELQTHREGNGLGGWVKNNWEYVAGGAMVVAGGVLIATGVGGPAGVMLISAGADTIIQKATTGEVNWGQVAVAGAAGAVGFGAAGAVARTAVGTGVRGTVAAGAAGGAAEGGFYGGGSYLTGPGPHTVSGLVTSTATGVAIGGVTGGAGAGAAHGVAGLASRRAGAAGSEVSTATRSLGDVPATPARPSPIDPDTGRLIDHVARAKGDFDADIIPRSPKEDVNLTNPRLSAATRGTMIDRQAKGYIDADPDLQHLYTTPAGHYGPDIIDPTGTGRWWDITTEAQWGRHQKKYENMGPGIGIFTN